MITHGKRKKRLNVPHAVALCAAALCFFSCRTEHAAFTAAAREGVFLFEAESFRLVDSEIVDDPEASGGKAVRIMSPRAFCSLDMELAPGTYVVRARARAEDAGHDEFFISAGKVFARVAPSVFGRYGICPQTLEVVIDARGREYLQFAAFSPAVPRGESGMTIDYLEVWEKAKWNAESAQEP